jgi:hypothetical protein
MIPLLFRRLILLLVPVLSTACSSFDARWKAAAAGGPATRWEGRWTSEKHVSGGGRPVGGRLRAVLEPAAQERLTAHFHANWMIFSSDYTMTLEPARRASGPRRAGVREFSGEHELSKMFGGVYRYTARLAGDQFTARYTSSYDHGTFSLQRLPARKD